MKMIDWIILALVALMCVWGIRTYKKNPCSGCGKNCGNCVLKNLKDRTQTL
ncbi:MAG: hypothetical protein IJM15_06710 [Erysipelotrichaceae bacterium]|nr:hypothetical protein [Erysipelotrichaceae bacterium]